MITHLYDLLGQLSGRRKHQCLALLHLRVKALEDANREGGGLAGS